MNANLNEINEETYNFYNNTLNDSETNVNTTNEYTDYCILNKKIM
jgi:hypothetical protein